MRKLSLILILICFSLLSTACAGRQVALGERFTLAEDETVKVKGEPLLIRLVYIGRDFTEEGEYAFAEVEIKYEGEWTTISPYVGDEWKIGEYVIYMQGANPFGDTSCDLVVEKP